MADSRPRARQRSLDRRPEHIANASRVRTITYVVMLALILATVVVALATRIDAVWSLPVILFLMVLAVIESNARRRVEAYEAEQNAKDAP